MPQPTTNDPPAPHPPVGAALRSLLVLGIACTMFGLVFVVAFGVLNPMHRFRPHFATLGTAAWLAPGISYLSCVYLMRRHRSGAATVALITAILQALCAAALLVASATFEPVTPLPIVFLRPMADGAGRLHATPRPREAVHRQRDGAGAGV